MSFEFSSLLSLLNRYQDKFYCKNCRQYYSKKWFLPLHATCFFCKRFNPNTHRYQTLLREIEWCFLQSGEEDQQTYYNHFIDNLSRWCNYFHIYPTKEDKRVEEELRSVDKEVL
jgi:hypothetical protein